MRAIALFRQGYVRNLSHTPDRAEQLVNLGKLPTQRRISRQLLDSARYFFTPSVLRKDSKL